jgi:prepilin-type N-terminal cleavage/methylation domain-containing protein
MGQVSARIADAEAMARARIGSQNGFTLVEVVVAISVLLIGVLGTVAMVDGANSLTSRNKSREGATALGRSVLEIARGVPYRQLTATNLLVELQSRDGFADVRPGVAGHQVTRENFIFTVVPTICSMDDPADNLGAHEESGVTFCPDSDGAETADRNADDYRRISVQLTWRSGAQRIETTTQRAIVTNPVGGLGPTVTELNPVAPATTSITSDVETASYAVTTSTIAKGVIWTVNGANRSDATGSDLSWSLTWGLGPVDAPTYYDCTYILQAEAFDEQDRAGAPKALTVTVDRRRPFPPPGFAAGRNLNENRVDISWARNRECDVKAYRVYRGTASNPGTINTLVCEREVGEATECIDNPGPGATFPLYYQVEAIDSGTHGPGDRTDPIEVTADNANSPAVPTGLAACGGGTAGCLDSENEATSAGTTVLSWQASTDPDGDEIAFYRIYRDGRTYNDRLGILFPVSGKPLRFVDSLVTGPHTYSVTAVDEHLGESASSAEVTWP